MTETRASVLTTAYSYVRFSTTKQELGDSLRRQVEMAESYCARHNLKLASASYRDLGVSAFKRKNIEKGALASFIQAVRSGKIEKGSYLVIEQFDRLSRAETNHALRLLLELVDSGIKVVTLVDEKVWDKDSIKDTHNLIIAIVYMSRANNESAMKAQRISSVWSEKKRLALSGESRKIVTSECPRWLKANTEKTGFVVIESIADSVKKVFLARIGGFGVNSIATTANKEGWPAPGKSPVRKVGEDIKDFLIRAEKKTPTWHTSTVSRLLKNRAVLGEYQPQTNCPEIEGRKIAFGEPIIGYYPAIIDETTFLRAQAKAQRDGRFPGRRDASLRNWLQGLLRCNCGNTMVRKNKNSLAQPGYARYYCSARSRGLSKCPGASAEELENAVIKVISFVAPAYFQGNERAEQLKSTIDALEAKLVTAREIRDRYAEAIGSSKASIQIIMKKLEAAEATVVALEAEIKGNRSALADWSCDIDSIFETIAHAVRRIDNLEERANLREELSRIITKVVVHQNNGYVSVHLRGQDVPIIHPLRTEAVSLPGISFTQTA